MIPHFITPENTRGYKIGILDRNGLKHQSILLCFNPFVLIDPFTTP